MAILLKVKIIFFIIINLMLLMLLYNIPINSRILDSICIFKNVTGNRCWNCGMTRAFLSVLHFDFNSAFQFNNKIIVVFPMTIIMYLYSWYKYIIRDVNKK